MTVSFRRGSGDVSRGLSARGRENDEIEVACDALWSVKQWGAGEDAQELLWSQLQPIRTGDYGGLAARERVPEGQTAVARALRRCAEQVGLDQDERRLLGRLTGAQ